MTNALRSLGAWSLALATLGPVCASAQSSPATPGGVQVIDMGPATPAPQKHAAKPSARPTATATATAAGLPGASALVHTALSFIGVPFRMGGTTPRAFDCSGFTQYAFASIGVRIPRTADQQFYSGRPIAGDPLPGDLVFFQTYQFGPSHVGLYLGGGRFVNAIGKDVHVDTFDSTYFRGRYLGARRFLGT